MFFFWLVVLGVALWILAESITRLGALRAATIDSFFTGLVPNHIFHQGINVHPFWWNVDQEYDLSGRNVEQTDEFITKNKLGIVAKLQLLWAPSEKENEKALGRKKNLVAFRELLASGMTLEEIDKRVMNAVNGLATDFFKQKEDEEVLGHKNEVTHAIAKCVREERIPGIDPHNPDVAKTIEETFHIDIKFFFVADLDYEQGTLEQFKKRAAVEIQEKSEQRMVGYTKKRMEELKETGLTSQEAKDFIQTERGSVKKEIREEKRIYDLTPSGAAALAKALDALKK